MFNKLGRARTWIVTCYRSWFSPGVFKTINDRQSAFVCSDQANFYGSRVKLLESSWCALGSETFVERLTFLGRCSLAPEPSYIKININIKLTNENKIVMLSQTHGYDQFVPFPKTVKSINIAGSLK